MEDELSNIPDKKADLPSLDRLKDSEISIEVEAIRQEIRELKTKREELIAPIIGPIDERIEVLRSRWEGLLNQRFIQRANSSGSLAETAISSTLIETDKEKNE